MVPAADQPVNDHVGAEFGRRGWEISFAVAAVVIVGRGLEVEFDFLTVVELGLVMTSSSVDRFRSMVPRYWRRLCKGG